MQAYSRLKQILHERRLSLPDLHDRIVQTGVVADRRSLDRLAREDRPVNRLDLRLAGAICAVCDVPLSDLVVFREDGGVIDRLRPEKQARLDVLMARNNDGQITQKERKELEGLVREVETLTLTNAQRLAQRRRPARPRKG